MTNPPNSVGKDSLQFRHLRLIDKLLQCPNGQEPEVLNSEPDLLTGEFVQALMQAASYFAHNDNPDSARFLIFIARELSVQLGLYPQTQATAQVPVPASNVAPTDDKASNPSPEVAMASEPSV